MLPSGFQLRWQLKFAQSIQSAMGVRLHENQSECLSVETNSPPQKQANTIHRVVCFLEGTGNCAIYPVRFETGHACVRVLFPTAVLKAVIASRVAEPIKNQARRLLFAPASFGTQLIRSRLCKEVNVLRARHFLDNERIIITPLPCTQRKAGKTERMRTQCPFCSPRSVRTARGWLPVRA